MKHVVLVVDDARIMRNIIKKTLMESQKYNLLEASDGEDAIEMYKKIKPDLVTMDITMDNKNGVDAAREILDYDARAKIIMVTALGQEKLLSECVQMGIKDYIVKPFTKERILSAVAKALDNNGKK